MNEIHHLESAITEYRVGAARKIACILVATWVTACAVLMLLVLALA
jgi:hypothetical protein